MMLAIAGLLIIIVTFSLVLSFNKGYSRKIRISMRIAGLILLIITLILIFIILKNPLLLIN